jgi:hypothetical protein
MQIQLREGGEFEVYRDCAVGCNPPHGAPRELARGKSIAQAVVEEGAKKDLFGSATEK